MPILMVILAIIVKNADCILFKATYSAYDVMILYCLFAIMWQLFEINDNIKNNKK